MTDYSGLIACCATLLFSTGHAGVYAFASAVAVVNVCAGMHQCVCPLSSSDRQSPWLVLNRVSFLFFPADHLCPRSFFSLLISLSGWGKRSMETTVNGWGAVHRLVSHHCRYSKWNTFLVRQDCTLWAVRMQIINIPEIEGYKSLVFFFICSEGLF